MNAKLEFELTTMLQSKNERIWNEGRKKKIVWKLCLRSFTKALLPFECQKIYSQYQVYIKRGKSVIIYIEQIYEIAFNKSPKKYSGTPKNSKKRTGEL